MTAQTLDATRLKTIRKARKIGRPKLAKLSGLTERQLAKLEAQTSADASLSDTTIERLAQALQITPLVLTGALPLAQEDLQPVAKSCTTGCCG